MGSTDLFDMSGRVAIVTGGTRGLGREICLAYAHHGAHVVVASRKEQACLDFADEIGSATGVRALGVATHVGKWADCDALIERTIAEFGHVDVLVNNAGMSPVYDTLLDVTPELFDKVIGVNLGGPFRLAALAGTRMAADRGGSIINVSSIGAVQPRPTELPYAAAKAGLNALTIGLARAFGPTVRVNAIMPGPFLTDIATHWDMDAFEALAARDIPLGRGGEPNEIVGAALYFAGPASSYTTGAVLKVDGGWAYDPG